MFRAQMGIMAPAPTSQTPQRQATSPTGITASQNGHSEGGIVLTPHQQPSLNDLCSVAEDIKDTLTAAITDLKMEIQAISGRVQAVEKNDSRTFFNAPQASPGCRYPHPET